jgi:hypothetical protein
MVILSFFGSSKQGAIVYFNNYSEALCGMKVKLNKRGIYKEGEIKYSVVKV